MATSCALSFAACSDKENAESKRTAKEETFKNITGSPSASKWEYVFNIDDFTGVLHAGARLADKRNFGTISVMCEIDARYNSYGKFYIIISSDNTFLGKSNYKLKDSHSKILSKSDNTIKDSDNESLGRSDISIKNSYNAIQRSKEKLAVVRHGETLADVLAANGVPKARVAGVLAAYKGRRAEPVREGQRVKLLFADFDGSGKEMQLARVSVYNDEELVSMVAAADRGDYVQTPIPLTFASDRSLLYIIDNKPPVETREWRYEKNYAITNADDQINTTDFLRLLESAERLRVRLKTYEDESVDLDFSVNGLAPLLKKISKGCKQHIAASNQSKVGQSPVAQKAEESAPAKTVESGKFGARNEDGASYGATTPGLETTSVPVVRPALR